MIIGATALVGRALVGSSMPPPTTAPLLVTPLYLIFQIGMSSLVIYGGQKTTAGYEKTELFSGGLVRGWFLSILAFGMGLRIFCNLAILLLPHKKPFLLAWLHFIPGLVLLSSYSLLIVFFADVRRESEGAVIPGGARRVPPPSHRTPYIGYITLGYIAPSLIACNLLLYFMFAIVGSLAHMRHAHREFRIAGSIFMGVIHVLVAGAWAYNAGLLSMHLIKRSESSADLIKLDDPFINPLFAEDASGMTPRGLPELTDLSCHERSSTFSGGGLRTSRGLPSPPFFEMDHYYLNSFGHMSREMRTVKWRLCLIALLCPLIFGLGGALEIYKGMGWTTVYNSAAINFFTEYSPINAVIYATEVLPALICIATFSAAPQQTFATEEKYVLSSVASSS